MYEHANHNFTVRHAIIITSARTFYENIYQVIVMTDGVTTYVLSFFVSLPYEYGYHGINNQFCERYTTSANTRSDKLYNRLKKNSNIRGIDLHKLTSTRCVRGTFFSQCVKFEYTFFIKENPKDYAEI